MSERTEHANNLLIAGWPIVKAVQSAIAVSPTNAEQWRDPDWWQEGVKFATEIPQQMKDLAVQDRPARTMQNGIQAFLQAEGFAMESEGADGASAVRSLGELFDALTRMREYTAGAAGNIRHMNLPSLITEIETSALELDRRVQRVLDRWFKAAETAADFAPYLLVAAALLAVFLFFRK